MVFASFPLPILPLRSENQSNILCQRIAQTTVLWLLREKAKP
jgi:hypothetical protein